MRVAVLTPYTEPHFGGITSYAREIALGYRELGLEVLGLAWTGQSNALFRVLAGGKLLFALRACAILLRWRPDIVHSHSHWHLLLPGVILRVLRRRTRLIFTFHTPWQKARHSIRFAALAFLLRFPSVVTFVSNEMRQSLGLPQAIRQSVVYAAPERLVGRFIPSRLRDERKPTILYVGPMVWPDKVAGLCLLLEAFALVTTKFPDWRLVIVGDGPLRGDVERRTHALGLQRVVELKGWVKDPMVQIATAEIYAQISLQEGLPLSLLNAMAMGLPVVATATGGIPELISDSVNGYLVPGDPQAISSALSRLMLNQHLRSELGAAAQRSTNRRVWTDVATEYITAAGAVVPEGPLLARERG